MSRRLAAGLAVLALALGLGATAFLALRFSAERQAGKPGTQPGDGAARPSAVMAVELRLEGARLICGRPEPTGWSLPQGLEPFGFSPDGRYLLAFGPGVPPPFGAAPRLGAPGGDWRDLSEVAGCTDWNVAVWLGPERLVLHLAGSTVVYDLARDERTLWAPLPDDRVRVAIALSPDGRIVACREGPRVFAAEPTDLVLRAPGGEELRRFPALGHTSPGEIIHHQTLSMAWLGDGSGVVYVDHDPERSVTSVAYLDLTSGRVSEIVAVPSLEGRAPYNVAVAGAADEFAVVGQTVRGVYVYRLESPPVGPLSPASTSPPYAGAILSPDGRLLAVAAAGATTIYLLSDLVSEPAAEPLVLVKAGQAFAWGSLLAEEAGRRVYALYLWPGP